MDDSGKVGIGTTSPNAMLETTGNIVIRNPMQNGALRLSPSSNGFGVNPELVIQSAESGYGRDTTFHISLNAVYDTSDNNYHYIDETEEASTISFRVNGDIVFGAAGPGADPISFTDHVTIENDGNVGIGTTEPDNKLTVAGDADFTGAVGIGTTSPSTELDVIGTVTATSFVGDGSGLTGIIEGDPSYGSSDGSPDEAIYVVNSGRVGIGTTTPTAPLQVTGKIISGAAGVTDGEILLEDSGGITNNPGMRTNSDGDLILRAHSTSGDIEFETGNEESIRMVVLQNGRVGIGTTEPSTELDVYGTVTATSFVGDGSGLTGISGGDPSYGSSDGSPDEAVYVDDSGYVGIGTTSPTAMLDVDGQTRTASLEITGSSGILLSVLVGWGYNNYGQIDVPTGTFTAVAAGSEFSLALEGTVADGTALLVSAGNVGIGTTEPGFLLEVDGDAAKPGGGSWSSSSDRRLKKNIADLDGALDDLLALRGVTFEYIDPAAINELPGTRIGMIAQEVEEVFPDWVAMSTRGHKTVTFRGFEALTVEALRELREEKNRQLAEKGAEIESLRSEVEQLRSQVAEFASLTQRVAQMEAGLQAKRAGSDIGN